MHINGTWDIRITPELSAFFQTIRKKGAYYWKLSKEEAIELIEILCKAYNIPEIPHYHTDNVNYLKARQCCGLYCWRGTRENSDIYTFPRPHFKTVAHEVYHHIDYYNRYGLHRKLYDSSDSKKHAWNFAERLWAALTAKKKEEPASRSMLFTSFDALRSFYGDSELRAPTKVVPASKIHEFIKIPLSDIELKLNVRKIIAFDNGTYLLQQAAV